MRGFVYQGNLHKFRQNPRLREALQGTGHQVLAEASPSDRIWGIGLSSADPRATNTKEWKGLKLAGPGPDACERNFSPGGLPVAAIRQCILAGSGQQPAMRGRRGFGGGSH